MTTQSDAKWIHEKAKTVSEYLSEKKKLDSAIAGRGFSNPPGFLYAMQTGLELAAKLKLSDINYQLLEETLQQDLKRYGLDYDLAFKNAQIAWELDKQVLLTEWDKELQGFKRAQNHEDGLLNLLAIEVSKRANILLAAKVAIELEAEALRKEIAELDGSTGEYELQLANAKLLTAQKKLELIPIIQQIIDIEEAMLEKEIQLTAKSWILVEKAEAMVDKEMEIVNKNQEIVNRQNEILSAEIGVISAEEDVVEAREGLVGAEQSLINLSTDNATEKETLIRPGLEALIAKLEEYVTELAVQQGVQDQITAKKLEIVGVKTEQVSKESEIIELKQGLAETIGELVTLTEGLVDYKTSTLAPAISELISMTNQYASVDVMAQAGFKMAIASIKEQMALLTPQKVTGELSILAAEVAQEAEKVALHDVESQIRTLEAQNTVTDAEDEVTKIAEIKTRSDEARDTMNAAQETSFAEVMRIRTDTQQKRFDINIGDDTEIINATMDAEEDRMRSDIRREEGITQIKIDTDVTARLSHLLSQD